MFVIAFASGCGTIIESPRSSYSPSNSSTSISQQESSSSSSSSSLPSSSSNSSQIETYTITFKNGSETLQQDNLELGATIAYFGNIPTKLADAEYTYSFKGWSLTENGDVITLGTVTGEATYYAVYNKTKNIYTITWVVNGTETTSQVAYGETPSYNGTPTKPATAEYTYKFSGWDKTIVAVTGDATYTAVFTEKVNSYVIKFVNGTTELQNETLEYGETISYKGTTPTKPADAEYTYSFKGWSKTQSGSTVTLGTVTGEATYYAIFTSTTNSYVVRFVNGSTTLEEKTLNYGATITYTGSTPTKSSTSLYTYTFKGWSKTQDGSTVTLGTVTGDVTYYAIFTANQILQYNVRNGSFDQLGSKVTSTSSQSLAIKGNAHCNSGTITVSVTQCSAKTASGVIFAVTNPQSLTSYWEKGVSYYFFYLKNDTANLGKVNDGWTLCQQTDYTVTGGTTYSLKVCIDRSTNKIYCYVNNVLQIAYHDSAILSGTPCGVRAASSGVVFDNLTTSTTMSIPENAFFANDYKVAHGSWNFTANNATSTYYGGIFDGNIAVNKNETFTNGTLEATVKLSGTTVDTGIIYGLTTNSDSFYEGSGISYYFFFIANAYGQITLGKTDNGTWSHVASTFITDFDRNGTFTLRVERTSTRTYLYVNNELYITTTETALTGEKFGIRTASDNTIYTNVTASTAQNGSGAPASFTNINGGKIVGTDRRFTIASGTKALYNDNFNTGTFSLRIAANSSNEAGVLFNYKDAGNYYRFYTQKSTQRVKISKVVNGVETLLYTNYLSAAYVNSNGFYFKVTLTGNKAYCHFYNTRYAIVDCDTTSASQIGVFASGDATIFDNFTTSTSQEVETVNTLMFGHSYFEHWRNYKSDLSALSLGSYLNIGIGGSVAEDWYRFKDSIVSYSPSRIIYMIGINDLSRGISPKDTANTVRTLLLQLKAELPDLQVILVGVNHCPARHTNGSPNVATEVSQTNVLYKEIVLDLDSWVNFVELEYSFCDSNNAPLSSWFYDGLHPNAAGYTDIMVPAIQQALNGQNQPTESSSVTAQKLANAKQAKIDSLSSYNQNGFRTTQWTTAKPIYDQAVAQINACTTRNQVYTLDLSSYITQLDAIKHNGDYFYEDILNQPYTNYGSNESEFLWETTTFTNNVANSSNGTFLIGHDGHRLNNTVSYSGDMDFKFSLSNNTGPTDVFGVLLFANQNSNFAIDGYMINIVTDPNYIQVWYFNNAWGKDGTNMITTYLGGWVYPHEVEDVTFRVIVKNGRIYIYNNDIYELCGASSYGCEADLTNNGTYPLYTSGHLGFISWKNNTESCPNFTAELSIFDVCGSVVSGVENAQQVTTNILSGTNSFTTGTALTNAKNGLVTASSATINLYKGLTASDFTMVVHTSQNPSANIDAGFLFRASVNSAGTGINGYYINVMSHNNSASQDYNQYIQIIKLTNYNLQSHNNNTWSYVDGWVYSNTIAKPICGQPLVIKVVGNTFTISSQTETITVNLDGTYTTGSFGYMSISYGTEFDLQINSIIC